MHVILLSRNLISEWKCAKFLLPFEEHRQRRKLENHWLCYRIAWDVSYMSCSRTEIRLNIILWRGVLYIELFGEWHVNRPMKFVIKRLGPEGIGAFKSDYLLRKWGAKEEEVRDFEKANFHITSKLSFLVIFSLFYGLY